MLEIAILWSCASSLGEIARGKGRRAGGYQFLLVVAWFLAEFLGVVAGVVLERSLHFGEPVLKYVVGLSAAAFSAWLVFQYVSSLSSLKTPAEEIVAANQAGDAAMAAKLPLPPDDGNPYRTPS